MVLFNFAKNNISLEDFPFFGWFWKNDLKIHVNLAAVESAADVALAVDSQFKDPDLTSVIGGLKSMCV